ncbi:MAG: hypothetical protein NTX03_07325 [Bacteroidetes bacterium]|nr:hypothetical protein [Bacteroidota bacterium]
MTEIEIIEAPVISPQIKELKSTVAKLANQVQEESQVIVHCSYTETYGGEKIRIWKSTFLYAKGSSHISKLVFTENVTIAPTWMPVRMGETVNFTLIFTGLPKGCTHFDLIEKIPAAGAFVCRNIERNSSDVYHIIIE